MDPAVWGFVGVIVGGLITGLVRVPAVALLAYVLGLDRGATPDTPGWVTRYHSQELHHILGS
jgi:hypothetical protein